MRDKLADRSPDGWRAHMRLKRADVDVPPGVDPDTYSFDTAPLYNGLNRNKRGLSLDATHPEGRELLARLLEKADVLVVNMTHRVLGDWGFEWERLEALNPGLVLVQMPALGATGPYRAMPGYGMLIEGMGGFAARHGDRSEPARATTTYYPDAVAGIHATLAALSGLARRARTGRGAMLDLSQQETTWLMLGEGIVQHSLTGREPGRMGNAEPGHCPSGFYLCADGAWIALSIRDDADWQRIAPEGLRALDLAQRIAERDRVDAAVGKWTSTRPCATVLDELAAAGIAARRVEDYRSTADHPGVAELAGLEDLIHPVTGRRSYLRIPVRVDGCPLASRSPAPVFDQHSDAILRSWLGLDDGRLRALRSSGAYGGGP